MVKKTEDIIKNCLELYNDLDLTYVKTWKEKHGGAKAMGFLPIYVPREIIYAAKILPVGLMGAGDRMEIIKGDAYYQSYICHIPRSLVELALSNKLNALDGMLCPSICDVIRNLSGVWQILFPDRYVKYFDFPQNFDSSIGGEFYKNDLTTFKADLERLSGKTISDAALKASIALYNENRGLVNDLYDLRSDKPWLVPTYELYLLLRAGNILDVKEHNEMLREYMTAVQEMTRPELDNIRVVLEGAFCEQPPLGLIRTLERAGCYIVDDDFVLCSRWLLKDVSLDGDPIEALVTAFLKDSTYSSAKYEYHIADKGQRLIEKVRKRKADGVIFACPSFCDPALLDRPIFQEALDAAGIAHTSFQYAENTGQFQVIKEQTGTFSDSIKLWSSV